MKHSKLNLKDIQTLDLLRELESRGHYTWVVSMGDVDLILETKQEDLTMDDKFLILQRFKDVGDRQSIEELNFVIDNYLYELYT